MDGARISAEPELDGAGAAAVPASGGAVTPGGAVPVGDVVEMFRDDIAGVGSRLALALLTGGECDRSSGRGWIDGVPVFLPDGGRDTSLGGAGSLEVGTWRTRVLTQRESGDALPPSAKFPRAAASSLMATSIAATAAALAATALAAALAAAVTAAAVAALTDSLNASADLPKSLKKFLGAGGRSDVGVFGRPALDGVRSPERCGCFADLEGFVGCFGLVAL